ncbi:hypothetical protein [Halotia branconii]|uniref:Uncharacterized protein n=1 Tax=Halotia branconii CENA392 TaxID=1539056 RepID=A0AAJ6NN47_9CYAN|nr:hypothetical protein [Halotia branconii]WGV23453.1 hypothetical protein QI031_16645 [Halotia branconii CENA392]
MNNEDLSSIPQPDPSWYYYILWHKLFKAKFKLEQLIKFVGDIEEPNAESHEAINEDLLELVNLLETTRLSQE